MPDSAACLPSRRNSEAVRHFIYTKPASRRSGFQSRLTQQHLGVCVAAALGTWQLIAMAERFKASTRDSTH